MQLRPEDANGDYTVGVPFLKDSPQLVAQLLKNRLQLWQGEWFVDITEGTPYLSQVLAERYNKNPNSAIRQRILGTPGVDSIVSYKSSFDSSTRILTVETTVQSTFSKTPIALVISLITPGG